MNEAIKTFEQKLIQSINEAQLPGEVIRLVLENTLLKINNVMNEPVVEETNEEVNEDAESTRCEPE